MVTQTSLVSVRTRTSSLVLHTSRVEDGRNPGEMASRTYAPCGATTHTGHLRHVLSTHTLLHGRLARARSATTSYSRSPTHLAVAGAPPSHTRHGGKRAGMGGVLTRRRDGGCTARGARGPDAPAERLLGAVSRLEGVLPSSNISQRARCGAVSMSARSGRAAKRGTEPVRTLTTCTASASPGGSLKAGSRYRSACEWNGRRLWGVVAWESRGVVCASRRERLGRRAVHGRAKG
jgi:hypothetical protein